MISSYIPTGIWFHHVNDILLFPGFVAKCSHNSTITIVLLDSIVIDWFVLCATKTEKKLY